MTNHYGDTTFPNGSSYVGWMDAANIPHGYGERRQNVHTIYPHSTLVLTRTENITGIWPRANGRFQEIVTDDVEHIITRNSYYEHENGIILTERTERTEIQTHPDGTTFPNRSSLLRVGNYSKSVIKIGPTSVISGGPKSVINNELEQSRHYSTHDYAAMNVIDGANNSRTIRNDGSLVEFRGKKTYRLDGTVETAKY